MLRPGTKSGMHGFQHRLPHAARGSPPARMAKAHGFLFHIHEIQRHAVGVKSAEHNPRLTADQAVHILIIRRPYDSLPTILFRDQTYIGGMGLFGTDDSSRRSPKNLRDPPEIFIHRLLFVPPGIA